MLSAIAYIIYNQDAVGEKDELIWFGGSQPQWDQNWPRSTENFEGDVFKCHGHRQRHTVRWLAVGGRLAIMMCVLVLSHFSSSSSSLHCQHRLRRHHSMLYLHLYLLLHLTRYAIIASHSSQVWITFVEYLMWHVFSVSAHHHFNPIFIVILACKYIIKTN